MIIGNFNLESGDYIRCNIGEFEIETAAIHIEDNPDPRFMWVCHNNPNKDGSASPVKYGFKYSWKFLIDGYTPEGYAITSDGVSNIQKLDVKIQYKKYTFDDTLSRFTSIYPALMPMFHYKTGLFDELNEYSISENVGFLKIKNDKRTIELKFGRFIQRMYTSLLNNDKNKSFFNEMFHEKMDPKNIEIYHNKYISFQNLNCFDLKFLKGDDILQGYTSSNYYLPNGTIMNSCMNDKLDYLNIYCKNPESIELAVLSIEDKILARTLIWNINDTKFHDRIYYGIDWASDLLMSKLSEIGINKTVFNTSDHIVLKLKNVSFNEYPYLDSLAYLNKESSTISNSIVGENRLNLVLRRTDGRAVQAL